MKDTLPLALVQPGEDDLNYSQRGGKSAVEQGGGSLYFAVGTPGDDDSGNWLDGATAHTCKIVIQYFDVGTEAIKIAYSHDASAEIAAPETVVTKTDTGTWLRAAYTLATTLRTGHNVYEDYAYADLRFTSTGLLILNEVRLRETTLKLKAIWQASKMPADDGYTGTESDDIAVDTDVLVMPAKASPGSRFIKWITSAGDVLGEIFADYGGSVGSLFLRARGKDSSYPTGVLGLEARRYDDSKVATLNLYSNNSFFITDNDNTQQQIGVMYKRDFSGGTTVQNTAVETTIYSATIKANTLGANGVLAVELGGDVQNNSGGAINLTFRVKLGGTTILTMRVAISSFSGTGGYYIRARLGNSAATNVQRAFGLVVAAKSGGFSDSMADYNTGAQDTTADKDLTITAQWASAAASAGVFSKGGVVELHRTNG